ncbi:hypothetical protein [Paraburkholderia rhynchosiae]|uniref:Uncharacterized protein n=1 Tax=Paraburkholderia rhynchosiae TaxID=487049 RepID=A0A2N7WTZ6_9BURK|nr:hypothetical protein [Paraburkholderia rhynchosiae]PMS32854.1 hypothetical protein C0Z16_04715 [Paraburkholderia rhynchosiae]CAB3645689.1 hypothetical protein LMG27174_00835 [Paraburkholderia rhynchosiae]
MKFDDLLQDVLEHGLKVAAEDGTAGYRAAAVVLIAGFSASLHLPALACRKASRQLFNAVAERPHRDDIGRAVELLEEIKAAPLSKRSADKLTKALALIGDDAVLAVLNAVAAKTFIEPKEAA